MLARIMAAEGASVKLRAGVLDTQRSVGQRIGKLFPTLTGEQFEDAAAEAGLPRVPAPVARAAHRAQRLHPRRRLRRPARDRSSQQTAEEALHLLDQAYALFVLINNRFVAGEKHRRRNDEPRPMKALSLHVTGIVQGVGFRPFVYNLARRAGPDRLGAQRQRRRLLASSRATGAPSTRFPQAIRDRAPAMAVIEHIVAEEVEPEGFPASRSASRAPRKAR